MTNRDASVVLIFVDGLGIGHRTADNPLHIGGNLSPLAYFVDETPRGPDKVMVPTDPRLGVPGRPQSASGQTTILTGANAPKLLGYHKQGFPNEKLRRVLSERSIFLQLRAVDVGPNTFANTYTPRFFSEKPRWKSATTCAVEAAGLSFNRLPDLIVRKSLFHDFTNRQLRQSGHNVPEFSPEEAGEILGELSSRYRFVLYEHFLTDTIGHAMDMDRARSQLAELAEFVRSAVEHTNLDRTTVILTSDHGNIEDLSIRNHTPNDVPTVIWGRRMHETAGHISDLSHITPAILRLLTE